MSTSNSILGKILVCLCCSDRAFMTAQCYNMWTACEAYGLCVLNCQACCWTLCAPVCHECKLGDTSEALKRCTTALKFCAFSCCLCFVSECDACYNCIFYNVDNCTTGVSGFKDVMKHSMWLGKKVETALGLKTSNEPETTYGGFRP